MRPAATFALATIVLALAVFAHGALAFSPDPTSYHRNGSLAFVDAESGIDLMHVDGGDREHLIDGAARPAWSPDGTELAYQDNTGVHVMNVSTGDIVLDYAEAQDPSWTPDGKNLLVSFFGDIVEVPLNHDQTTNLTNTPDINESDPVESPDGLYVAFTSNEDPASDPSAPTVGLNPNLWLMNTVDYIMGAYILVEDDTGNYVGHPSWSPDSGYIAYTDGGDIWTVVPGNNETNLTNDSDLQDYPAWSPDGTRIAYTQFQPAPLGDHITPSEIWTINAFGNNMRVNLTNNDQAHDTMAAWQAWQVQNGRIALLQQFGSGVVTMNPDGSHRTPFGLLATPLGSSTVRDYQWSPDGKLMAFVSGDGFISVVDALGLPELINNFNDVDNAQSVSWYPDGHEIAYEREDPNTSDHDVYGAAIGNNPPVDLTNTATVDEYGPEVSPDGSRIAFISDQEPFSDPPVRGNSYGIWTTDQDGNDRQFLTSIQVNGSFSTSGHQLSWAPDGTLLAYSSGYDIWTVEPNGNNPHNLTNDALLQVDVSWSPDGREIAYDQGSIFTTFQIWMIDPNNSHRTRVSPTDAEFDYLPAWQPIFAPGSESYFVWGDDTCTGLPQLTGLLSMLKSIAQLPPQHVPGCPWIGESGLTSTNAQALWGDTNCSGALDGTDVIDFFDYYLEMGDYLPVTDQPQGSTNSCPPIGVYLQWIPTS